LVAPVTEPDAKKRSVYLPEGNWFDFWTGELMGGGREIQRSVDLETMPLYVKAGSILPLGPVKQYVSEPSDQPLSISVYPGVDASYLLYEDDGISFNYRKGEWMGIEMTWSDVHRRLSLKLAKGSRMLTTSKRMEAEVRGGEKRRFVFDGSAVSVAF
jgi:alpha-glucosidase (family GH31 glycosyl hydrolase)